MQIIQRNGKNIAVVDTAEPIHCVQDALDIMAAARYQGDSENLVVYKESLNEDFFNLKTRLAGEILQKFSNYHVRLAIVGDFSIYKSKALNDFIYECNKGNLVFFVGNLETALDRVSALN